MLFNAFQLEIDKLYFYFSRINRFYLNNKSKKVQQKESKKTFRMPRRPLWRKTLTWQWTTAVYKEAGQRRSSASAVVLVVKYMTKTCGADWMACSAVCHCLTAPFLIKLAINWRCQSSVEAHPEGEFLSARSSSGEKHGPVSAYACSPFLTSLAEDDRNAEDHANDKYRDVNPDLSLSGKRWKRINLVRRGKKAADKCQ